MQNMRLEPNPYCGILSEMRMGTADLIKKYDELACIDEQGKLVSWLERLAFGFLIIMTLTAPVSIAATQTAWLLGMVFWVARFFFKPRPKFIKTVLFVPFFRLFRLDRNNRSLFICSRYLDRQASRRIAFPDFLFCHQ